MQGVSIGINDSEQEALDLVVKEAEDYLQKRRKEPPAFTQQNMPALLHETRSGKVAFKPFHRTKEIRYRRYLPIPCLPTLIIESRAIPSIYTYGIITPLTVSSLSYVKPEFMGPQTVVMESILTL
jgi:hypothetical protein